MLALVALLSCGGDDGPTRASYTRSVVTGDPAPICPAQTTSVLTSVISRYQSTNNGMSLNVGPDEILKVGQPYTNHNGGNIQFGLDGMLYLGLGDGGSGGDPCKITGTISKLVPSAPPPPDTFPQNARWAPRPS
jgi:hypothetical protein